MPASTRTCEPLPGTFQWLSENVAPLPHCATVKCLAIKFNLEVSMSSEPQCTLKYTFGLAPRDALDSDWKTTN
jgi:hypothetical protein